MTATLFTILSKSKDHPARRAMLADFVLDAGTAVPADRILTETGWTLYCLEQSQSCAVFIRTDPSADLEATPFLRMAQYEHASQVMLVPWDELDALAARVPLTDNMIFVFNIARSGTTLVSRMLGLVDGVYSLSEPNVQLDITMNRKANGDERTRQLIAACTRLQCAKPDGTVAKTVAFKTYSQSLFNCAEYHAAFPSAKYVFLYRDAVGWANSLHKMAKGYGMPDVIDREYRDRIWGITSAHHDISILEASLPTLDSYCQYTDVLAACWNFNLDCYIENLKSGVPFLALRYNEINSDRENATRTLLAHCGLSETATTEALRGFEKDSQSGSGIGQDNEKAGMTPESTARFLAAMARQRNHNSPDVILPDIYKQKS